MKLPERTPCAPGAREARSIAYPRAARHWPNFRPQTGQTLEYALPLKHPPDVTEQKDSRLVARFFHRVSKRGWRFGTSEILFRVARGLAVNPDNSAHPARDAERRELRKQVQRLTTKVQKLSGRVEALDAKRIERHAEVLRLKGRLAETRERLRSRLQAQTVLLDNMKSGTLFTYDAASLARMICPVCDASGIYLLPYPYSTNASFSRLLVALCTTCGFGWVPSLPFDLDAYYRTEYGSANRRDRGFAPEEYFAFEGKLHAVDGPLKHYFQRSHDQLDLIRRFKDPIGRMLDFGSGPGYALFLSGAQEKHAVEPDDESLKYLDYLGARRIALEDASSQYYDVILASHSLEHVPVERMYSTLAKLRDTLRPDGVLCVEVPNASLASVHWAARHVPHTLFFSPGSFVRLLERAGFEILLKVARIQQDRPRVAEPLVAKSDDEWNSTTHEGMCLVVRRSPADPVAPPTSSFSIGARLLAPA